MILLAAPRWRLVFTPTRWFSCERTHRFWESEYCFGPFTLLLFHQTAHA